MPSSPALPLGRAYLLAGTVARDIRQAATVDDVVPVGGLRRYAAEVSNVALLVVAGAARHRGIVQALASRAGPAAVTSRGSSTATVETPRGQVTVYLADPEHAGASLVWHTGSRQHLERLSVRALERGLRFDGSGLWRGGVRVTTPAESDCYAALDLPIIAPELRESGEEVALAAAGQLPALVTREHIRGDLHMHTTWSDGRDGVEAMVLAASELGYEYIAITDHSQGSLAARRLELDHIARQRAEIEAVRDRARGIQVLHGVEVDILHDGALDFDDEVLAGFDIVLASLHDHGGHDAARLNERYRSALRHPLVNVITHPANRAPGHSPGYDVDFDGLYAAAVDTGTALEVDGAPGHLDLDGERARQAIACGVTLTIDSDAHRAEWLRRQMRFGVGTARRGWVEPRHVLNTRSVDEVRAFVARKRARA